MSRVHVVEHHLDTKLNVYRLVVGVAKEIEPPRDGNEAVTELVPLEDFVWDADDERWQDMLPEDVVAEQRRIVKEALELRGEAREQVAAEQRASIQHLPGRGEAL